MYAMVDRSGLDDADVDTEGLDMHEAALSQPSIIWLDEADDAGPYTDLPDFDIPEDPGVPESELPQDPFGEFYLMLELEYLRRQTPFSWEGML